MALAGNVLVQEMGRDWLYHVLVEAPPAVDEGALWDALWFDTDNNIGLNALLLLRRHKGELEATGVVPEEGIGVAYFGTTDTPFKETNRGVRNPGDVDIVVGPTAASTPGSGSVAIPTVGAQPAPRGFPWGAAVVVLASLLSVFGSVAVLGGLYFFTRRGRR